MACLQEPLQPRIQVASPKAKAAQGFLVPQMVEKYEKKHSSHASISAFEAPGWSFATLGIRHFRWHHVGWFPVNFRWSLEKIRRAQECWRKNSRKAPQEMSKTSLFPPWMLPSRYRRSHWSDPKLTSGPDAKAGWRLPFLGHFWTYPCEPFKIARLIGTKFQNLPKLLGNIGYDDNL